MLQGLEVIKVVKIVGFRVSFWLLLKNGYVFLFLLFILTVHWSVILGLILFFGITINGIEYIYIIFLCFITDSESDRSGRFSVDVVY